MTSMAEEYNSRCDPQEEAERTPEHATNETADVVGAKPVGLVAPKIKSVEHCQWSDCQYDEEPSDENTQ